MPDSNKRWFTTWRVVDMDKLQKELVEAWKRSGKTFYRVAKESGVRYDWVREILSEKRRFSRIELDTMIRLAWALGLDPCELMKRSLKDGVAAEPVTG